MFHSNSTTSSGAKSKEAAPLVAPLFDSDMSQYFSSPNVQLLKLEMDDSIILVSDLSEYLVVEHSVSAEYQIQKSGVLIGGLTDSSKILQVSKLNAVSFLLRTAANYDYILNVSKQNNSVKFSLKKYYYSKPANTTTSTPTPMTFIGLNLNIFKIYYTDQTNIFEINFSSEKVEKEVEPVNVGSFDNKQKLNSYFVFGDPSLNKKEYFLIMNENNLNSNEQILSYTNKNTDSSSVVTFFNEKSQIDSSTVENTDSSVYSRLVYENGNQTYLFHIDFKLNTVSLTYTNNLNKTKTLKGKTFSNNMLPSAPLKLFYQVVENDIGDFQHTHHSFIEALENSDNFYDFVSNLVVLNYVRIEDIVELVKNNWVNWIYTKFNVNIDGLAEPAMLSQGQNLKIQEFLVDVVTAYGLTKFKVTLDKSLIPNTLTWEKSVSATFDRKIDSDSNSNSNAQYFSDTNNIYVYNSGNLLTYQKSTFKLLETTSITTKTVSDSYSVKLYQIGSNIFYLDQNDKDNALVRIKISNSSASDANNQKNPNEKVDLSQITTVNGTYFVNQTDNSIQVYTIENSSNANTNTINLKLQFEKTFAYPITHLTYINDNSANQRKYYIEKDILFVNYYHPVVAVVTHNTLATDFFKHSIEFIDLSTYSTMSVVSLTHALPASISVASKHNEFVLNYFNSQSSRNEILAIKLFYDLDLNAAEDLELYESLKEKIDNLERLDYGSVVHTQVLISSQRLKQLIPLYTKHNFYPSSWILHLADNQLQMCSSVSKLYVPTVLNTEIYKVRGIEEKLQLNWLNHGLTCLNSISETKNMPVDFFNYNYVHTFDDQDSIEVYNYAYVDALIFTVGRSVNIVSFELNKSISDYPKDMGEGMLWSLLSIAIFIYYTYNMRHLIKL